MYYAVLTLKCRNDFLTEVFSLDIDVLPPNAKEL
jgi:hypothetical protein